MRTGYRARIRGMSGALIIDDCAPVGDNWMRLFEHEGREVFLVDRAVIETVECLQRFGSTGRR